MCRRPWCTCPEFGELQAEVERLAAERDDLSDRFCSQALIILRLYELSDQLAEALRYMKPPDRSSWAGAAALDAWEAAQLERV